MRKVTLFLAIAALLFGIAPIRAQTRSELVVFAAASLTNAMEDIGAAFEAENPNVDVLFNFGASSTLAAQLVEGAPADVFASANVRQMTVAVEAGRIAGEPVTFAHNRLVLIAPGDNPASLTSLDDLVLPGIKLVVAAPDVPVRTYTDTMLEKMAADPTYGEDYRGAVLANVVSEEANVRQVAAKVALGEADAGIVYFSDVTPDITDDVVMFTIPDAYNTIATYPIAITNDTTQPELAQGFVDFVLSDDGQAILSAWNLIPVNVAEAPAQEVHPLVRLLQILWAILTQMP